MSGGRCSFGASPSFDDSLTVTVVPYSFPHCCCVFCLFCMPLPLLTSLRHQLTVPASSLIRTGHSVTEEISAEVMALMRRKLRGREPMTAAQWLVQQLDAIGYTAEPLILNALHFYLPQRRARVYMMAVKRPEKGRPVSSCSCCCPRS